MIEARRRYKGGAGEQESPKSLLQSTCVGDEDTTRAKAADPRDVVYGFLSIASDADLLEIYPEYWRPTAEVYISTTRALIANGHIDILCWCQQSTRMVELPTWVPDYSSSIRSERGAHTGNRSVFRASGNAEFSGILAAPNAHRGLLTLSSILVDTVGKSGTALDLPGDVHGVDMAPVLGFMREIETFCEQSFLLVTNAQKQGASIRVPCADREMQGVIRQRVPRSLSWRYDIMRLRGERTFDSTALHYRIP